MESVGRSAKGLARPWQRRWLQALVVTAILTGLGLMVAAEYIRHHAEPILRKRILETLSARFDAPITLDRVDISLFKGLEVNGYGLRIPFPAGIQPNTPRNTPLPGGAPPMVAVTHFAFRTSFRSLMRQPTRVAAVRVDGMELHIPPPGARPSMFAPNRHADPEDPRLRPKIAMVVGELRCRDVKLFIEPGKPGKVPLEFDIATLDLWDVGKGEAMRYDATLTNPKPVGLIHAAGHFGPWAGTQLGGRSGAEAGQTPLDGHYTFDRADLNTIKGIGGMLSSRGRFAGVLDRIAIDGETDVPNFSLDISDRPVPLHTDFHAMVDGTSGDTYLEPVHARLGDSEFTTRGRIVKVQGKGHDIVLSVHIPHGRMQDFLRLAVKTRPPLMNGVLTMKADLHIPPGDVRVAEKLAMAGAFQLTGVRFNNPKLQDRIDGLSARAQGKPREVAAVSQDHEAEVPSALAARFTLGQGLMEVDNVHYTLPGALVLLNGVYSMDGRLFEFKGRVRTQATASQMVAGWKGWLLKPLDALLAKNGAGVELPIEISGTGGEVHLGLATHGIGDSPQQMLTDARQKDGARRQISAAQREAVQAGDDDRAAARAPTIEAAEAAHKRAVQRRAEAGRRIAAVRGNPDTAPQH